MLKEHNEWKLRMYEMTVLRNVCGVTRKDKTRNLDIMKKLAIERDVAVLQAQRLTYLGHVSLVGNNSFPKLFIHDHTRGTRQRGRLRKSWIDSI